MKPLATEQVVYRGVANHGRGASKKYFEKISKAKTGDIIVPDEGYSFAGTSKTNYETFAKPSKLEKDNWSITYEIHIPEKSKVSRGIGINPKYGEEYVMKRGAKYKVLQKTDNENGGYHIVLEYIPDGLPKKIEMPAFLKEYEEMLKNIPQQTKSARNNRYDRHKNT